MIIRVRGTYERFYPPERGTVVIRLGLEGPTKSPVTAAMTGLIKQVTDLVRKDHHPSSGPITWYSQSQMQNSSYRPWNKDGRIMPLVYRSRADLKVKFSDLGRLFGFVETVSDIEGVDVQRIEWALTQASRRKAVDSAQAEAVKDAFAKAGRYAEAVGLHTVTPRMVADPGLLTDGAGQGHIGPGYRAATTSLDRGTGGASGMEFKPEDISVECNVEAEFEAV